MIPELGRGRQEFVRAGRKGIRILSRTEIPYLFHGLERYGEVLLDADIPPDTGAYAILIRLSRPLNTAIGALGAVKLPRGEYLYLGSAYGPGGLRARIKRHLRTEKRPHWHVDHLTMVGNVIAVLAVPGGRECGLVNRALDHAGVTAPIAGFGSSDCHRCPAHLLRIATDGEDVIARLPG